jgi:hypothetical protein
MADKRCVRRIRGEVQAPGSCRSNAGLGLELFDIVSLRTGSSPSLAKLPRGAVARKVSEPAATATERSPVPWEF